MKVERKNTVFEPIVITIENADDARRFRNMVEFAYDNSSSCSEVEQSADSLMDHLNKVSA